MSKRTFKEDKLAKLYDAEVVPIWSRRFGRMLLRDLTIPHKAMVLDVNCGSGYPSLDLLKRMDEQGRIIAIDSSSPLLDEARTKAGKLSGKRIFFRSESQLPKLPFADDVYDLVVANAGVQQIDDPEPAVRECARVAKVDGRVIATYPLAGTFAEFYDLLREVLIKGDYKDAIDRLDAYLTRYPPLEQAAAWFEDAGLVDIEAEQESFTLLFKSSREFFFAPIIEYGPLSAWKAVAGKGQQMQDVFWQTKAAIDAYFHGSSFSVTVFAGCVRGRKVAREPSVVVPVPPATELAGGAMKGERASSGPRRQSGSRRAEGAPERELPDAPSDEVDALSGSWPMPVNAPTPEPSVTGSSSSIEEPRRPMQLPEAHAPLDDYVDDIPTMSRERTPPRAVEGGVEPADVEDSVTLDEDEDHDIIEDREASGSASVELGTGEIELVEGSSTEDKPAPRGVRKVQRPDDPDDPDIL